jgi:predicted  nucleic acid-binding Zn-ribbon protein
MSTRGSSDGQLADPAAPRESAGPGGRTERHQPNADGRLLADLAEIDKLAFERDAGWKRLAQRRDALRREVALTGAQIQRSRSLAEHMPSQDEEDVEAARPSALTRDEDRASRLMQEFEAVLRQTEERRVAFHSEMDDLRRRRQALLQRLSASVSRAYRSLADAGRLPAIAAVVKGACGGCESPLPESVIEALSHGAAAVCARCDRLLHLARQVE